MKISKPKAIAVGTVILVLAGGGTALAATMSGPVGSSGVIDGCYSNIAINGSHALVLQDQGTSCPAGTTAVSWNKQGPQGIANIDRGVITATEANQGGYTCSESATVGPDAASITVVAQPNGCEIKGLSATDVFEVTPDGPQSPPVGDESLGMAISRQSSPTGLLFQFDTSGVTDITPFNDLGAGYTFSGTYDWMVMLPS